MKKIMIIGLGYVGLSLATLLSQENEVFAFDIDEEKIHAINGRRSPINDNEIIDFFKKKSLKLIAYKAEHIEDYLDNMDFVVVSVPTDYVVEEEYFDTTILDDTLKRLREKNTTVPIIIKSTIPIGYVDRISSEFSYKNIIFIPEFLRETKALYDNLYPSRIVVGYHADCELENKVDDFVTLLKKCALKKDIEVLKMSPKEAEGVKLFSNTYLAMRVAYFNELDTFAEQNKLDAKSLIKGVALDERIGKGYNNPSFGYGGYCLPKDTKQLLANFKTVPQNMISAIIKSNATRKNFIAKQIITRLDEIRVKNEKVIVGIYRLVMKEGSDNFRESSIVDIIKILKEHDVELVIYEPTIKKVEEIFESRLENNLEDFKEEATLIVANRFNDELSDVVKKVYTRDIFQVN